MYKFNAAHAFSHTPTFVFLRHHSICDTGLYTHATLRLPACQLVPVAAAPKEESPSFQLAFWLHSEGKLAGERK